MNKLLIAVAAAAFAGALAPCAEAGFNLRLPAAAMRAHAAPVKAVGCDEDCVEYLEDQGYELLEPADGNDDEPDTPRRSSFAREARSERVVRKSERAQESAQVSAKGTGKDDSKQAAPKSPEPKKAVASATPGSCRQYFPSAGMTLSVPCE
jgi:hypothetical protein